MLIFYPYLFGGIFDSIKGFLDTLWKFFTDPIGTASNVGCGFLSFVAGMFPSTPEAFTLAGLAQRLGDSVPFLGSGIFYKILRDFGIILGLALAIKIYKLIPFKMT